MSAQPSLWQILLLIKSKAILLALYGQLKAVLSGLGLPIFLVNFNKSTNLGKVLY